MAEDVEPRGNARHERSGVVVDIHRFLGGFPTAFFTLALVMDYVYMQSGTFQYQYFATWLIVAALITGAFAVLAGMVDWFTGPKGRAGLGWHLGLTVLALLLGLLNAFVHSRDGWRAVVPEGILLSLVVVVLLYAGGIVGAMIDRRAHRSARTDRVGFPS